MQEFHVNKQYKKIKTDMLICNNCELSFDFPWDSKSKMIDMLMQKLVDDGYTVKKEDSYFEITW